MADKTKSGIVLNRIPYVLMVSPKKRAINNEIKESPTKKNKILLVLFLLLYRYSGELSKQYNANIKNKEFSIENMFWLIRITQLLVLKLLKTIINSDENDQTNTEKLMNSNPLSNRLIAISEVNFCLNLF